ncbi:MAG: hypothetical protein FJZ61_00350 [Chlamydiae bacterium]|nr:hypothetical protein [Chlamydiota bacterium]
MSANTPISSSSQSSWLQDRRRLIQTRPPLSMPIQWPSPNPQAARKIPWSVMHRTTPNLNDISTYMHRSGLGVVRKNSETASRHTALVQHNGSAGSPQSSFQLLDFLSNLPSRILGPSLDQKIRCLRENGNLPPSGLIQRALCWIPKKGLELVKGPFERYTFFQKGRLLLQNPSNLNADLNSWCQQALSTYKFSDPQRALLTRCSSGISGEDLEGLKLLVAAELDLTQAELPLPQLTALAAQALFFNAGTARPALGAPQPRQNPDDQLGFIHEIEKILQGADLTSEVGRIIARKCVLPPLQFILEKIEQSPSTQQLQPYVRQLKTQLSAVGSALDTKSPEDILSAFTSFTQVLNQRPPIAIQGIGIIGAGSLSEPVSIRPLDEDLLTPSRRHASFEDAKEVTNYTMGRFERAFSAYSTLSICNLFLKTSDRKKYDYPELLEQIEQKKHERSSLSEKELFIRELQNLIQKDKEANWLKRLFFGSRHVLSLIFWFSEKIVSVCSQSILTKMRSDMQQIQSCESGESNTKRLPFELLNSPLCNMIRMYRSAAQPESGKHRDSASLETVMESVSKEPDFYDGMSETTLKNRVTDKIISDYLPRIKLEEGYLELIKGLPGQSVLKVLLPIVRALDYIPNKFIAWFSRKLLNETDALTVIFDSIKTKRNQSTNLELTIYQSLHEELARVYKGMQHAGNDDTAEVQLSSQGLKEIRALCHQIAQIRRLKGFSTEKQLSDYMKNDTPLAEQAEGYLIDQNEAILGDLFMSVYRSVTDKISLETQLNTVVETAISSIESSANPNPGALQKQIASEKDSIGRLLRSILQISIDRGIDSALESKPYQTEAMAQIKKMVSIQLLRESIKNLKSNPNSRSIKAVHAQNLRLLLMTAQRQIIVYSSSLDRSQTLNPTDLNLLKSRLSCISECLGGILLQASELMDRYTYESLVLKPEVLIRRLLAVFANPTHENKKELTTIRKSFIESRHLFNKFSNWNDLDSSITSACALAGKLTSQEDSRLGEEQRALIDAESAKLRALEQTFSALPENSVTNDAILGWLEEESSEGHALDVLLETRLEREEVDIPLLTKDSPIVRVAKNQTTSVLNNYLNDMVVLLADPLLHEVTLKTWLASFVNYKK